jgi:hypothetical protein
MYDHQQIDEQIVQAQAIGTAADPISGARRAVGSQPVVVRALWATVTTVVATSTIVLTYKYRPTPGSATGEVTLGTVSVPTSAIAGKQVYKEITPYQCNPGGEIVVQTGGNGGSTGNATLGYRCTPKWESPTNNANMIASA